MSRDWHKPSPPRSPSPPPNPGAARAAEHRSERASEHVPPPPAVVEPELAPAVPAVVYTALVQIYAGTLGAYAVGAKIEEGIALTMLSTGFDLGREILRTES